MLGLSLLLMSVGGVPLPDLLSLGSTDWRRTYSKPCSSSSTLRATTARRPGVADGVGEEREEEAASVASPVA